MNKLLSTLFIAFTLSACGGGGGGGGNGSGGTFTLPASYTIAKGEHIRILPVLSTGASFHCLDLTIADTNILTEYEDGGIATGASAGVSSLTITCTSDDLSTTQTLSTSVTVLDVSVVDIKLTPALLEFDINNPSTINVQVKAVYSDGSLSTNDVVFNESTSGGGWHVGASPPNQESVTTFVGTDVSEPGHGGFNIHLLDKTIEILWVAGVSVPADLKGQWQLVHNGEKKWINTVLDYATYTKVDNNLLKVTGSDNNFYYLVRAGIPNVQVSGQLNDLINALPKSYSEKKETRALSIGDIGIILEGIDNDLWIGPVTPGVDGSFDVILPSSDYEITAVDGSTGNTVTAEFEASGTAKDIGEFTLVDQAIYNFKSTILLDRHDNIYFGTRTGQPEIVYTGDIRVKNIGNQTVSGLSFTITSPDAEVRTLDVTNTLGGMDPDGYVDIPVSFSFTRPASDKEVTFDIAIKDINNQEWSDHVSLPLSSRVPIEVTLSGATGSIVTPARELVDLSSTMLNYLEYGSVYLPYVSGTQYEAVFSVPNITSEEAFCLGFGPINYSEGIGLPSDVCVQSLFDNFTETGINEPDNDSASATTMTLNQVAMGYLHVGDIDFISLSMDGIKKPFDGYIEGSLALSQNARGIDVVGNYAYVANETDGLIIVDISNPASPAIAGSYTAASAFGVEVVGNYAYLTVEFEGLRIVDISTPATPVLVGSQVIAGSRTNVTVNGNYAYVTTTGGLSIVDISTPATPSIVGTVTTPGSAESVVVSGNYAYVADQLSGLQIVDISTPATPSIVANVASGDRTYGVQIVGNYAYMSDNANGLVIVDISTPASPTVVGSTQRRDSNTFLINSVTVDGDYAYLSDYNEGVMVVDISTPASPAIVGRVTVPSAVNAKVVGNYLFATNYDSGNQAGGSLEIVNITPPSGL